MNKHIVINGTLQHGFTCYGPFDTKELAMLWIKENSKSLDCDGPSFIHILFVPENHY